MCLAQGHHFFRVSAAELQGSLFASGDSHVRKHSFARKSRLRNRQTVRLVSAGSVKTIKLIRLVVGMPVARSDFPSIIQRVKSQAVAKVAQQAS